MVGEATMGCSSSSQQAGKDHDIWDKNSVVRRHDTYPEINGVPWVNQMQTHVKTQLERTGRNHQGMRRDTRRGQHQTHRTISQNAQESE